MIGISRVLGIRQRARSNTEYREVFTGDYGHAIDFVYVPRNIIYLVIHWYDIFLI